MAKGRFHVRDTFEKPARDSLVLVGSVLEGEIHPGMFIRVPVKPGKRMNLLITGIGVDCVNSNDELDVSIQAGLAMMELFRTLSFKDQTFDVEDFGSEE